MHRPRTAEREGDRGAGNGDETLALHRYEDAGDLDFGDIEVGDRPADWEEQLRAGGCPEDWIAAYRPPEPEVPTPAEGMEKTPPWKCHLCNRFQLTWQQGEEAGEDLYNFVLMGPWDDEPPIQEDEIAPFVEVEGEKWRSAMCLWCDTPVYVLTTGPHRGSQE